ncbi:uncharacterized protein LOC100206790 isoform X2 [Hydra vulgaris]|uniref:Uncharacterized protein LOC100206790 isoform X2 n=1 Tax=Hydra vulgaris TaxID=6087 RepID=A0ABM4D8G5_HYDVU
MKVLGLVFHFICFISVSYGFYFFDLFTSVDLSKVKGVNSVAGPENGTFASLFSDNTDFIKLSSSVSNEFAYILHTISTSNDVTFATQFKITVTPDPENRDGQQFMSIFTLLQTNPEKILFTIGFKFVQTKKQVENVVIQGEKKQYVYIGRWKDKGKDKVVTEVEVVKPHSIKTNVWQTLMVRIHNNQVTVSIDCKEVATQKIDALTETYILKGFLSLAQITEIVGFGTEEVTQRFLGALYNPQIYNGNDAYEYYNPCTSDSTPSFVPSEPRPQDYNPAKFNRFAKMVASADAPVVIICKDGETNRLSGETWKKPDDSCYLLKCSNGVIVSTYVCPTCKLGTKSYLSGEKFISPDDKCMLQTCQDGDMVAEKINCNPLSCDKFGSFTDPKECCSKCYSDSCSNGTSYYEGCERKCGIVSNFQCAVKSPGCWCPDGKALNDLNECVPLSDCNCRSGSKIYLPGQAVVRSSCQTCICANGAMRCSSKCVS